jgi:hypothetical protein
MSLDFLRNTSFYCISYAHKRHCQSDKMDIWTLSFYFRTSEASMNVNKQLLLLPSLQHTMVRLKIPWGHFTQYGVCTFSLLYPNEMWLRNQKIQGRDCSTWQHVRRLYIIGQAGEQQVAVPDISIATMALEQISCD